jgi:hypothetical protein
MGVYHITIRGDGGCRGTKGKTSNQSAKLDLLIW